MIDSQFIKKLSQEIHRKRFFLERLAVFEEEFEDRIIFLYPVSQYYKPKDKTIKDRHYFLGVLENFKLCLLEIQEKETKSVQLQSPVFSIDIRSFISEDILKVKITDFLGLKIEFYGDNSIPLVNLDVVYYTLENLEMERERDVVRDYLCQTISFPLAQLFERKSRKTQYKPGESTQSADDIFPVVNRYECQCGIRSINIGTLNENYKSIGYQGDEMANTLILKSWNPYKKMEIKKIPGDTGNEQIIALHSDENNIFVSCENERIYQLDYHSDRYNEFKPGNNLFAMSLLKIGDYLFAAMTNRAIYRIHLKSREMDFHILESAPLFLASLGKDKIIVTTKQKQLLVFYVNNEIITNEVSVYEHIRKDWNKIQKIDIRNYCKEILQKEKFEESHIAALEFAAYSWLKLHPKDVYTPLKALIYVIDRYFRHKSDKGDIILRFINHCKELIFSDYEKYSLLMKEFYITSSDKNRSDFLKVLQAHFHLINKEIKNELDFLDWNGSDKEREEKENLLNLFGLLWFYKDGFYIEYVRAIPTIQNSETRDTLNQVISYFRIDDTRKDSQRIAVVESKKYYLFLLDRSFFEDDILPDKKHLVLDKKSIIRKIEFTSEENYLFFLDETQELKIFDLASPRPDDSFLPTLVPLTDLPWDLDTIPVHVGGKAFELVVVGFKNSGLKIYIFDFEQPDTLALLYEKRLQDDWIRDLDIIALDDDSYCYEIAAVGSKRKKLYRFVFQLLYDAKGDSFKVKETDFKVKKSTRSLYCVKFFLDNAGNHFIVVGSEQGDLYFMDHHLNIQWQQKLDDSIQQVKIFWGKDEGGKEIVVGVGNGDIFFFTQDSFIRREIRFGKPLHSIDTAPLNLEKGKAHFIACMDNRLMVYEINQECLETKIADFKVLKHKMESKDKNLHLYAFHNEIACFCETIANNGFDPRSPVLILAESLGRHYRCQYAESIINQFRDDSTGLLDYYKKDKELFLQSLGYIIDNTYQNNYQSIEKIISFINEQLGNDEKIQWNILKFYQKVYQNYKHGEKANFLDELNRLLKDKTTKKIKPVYARSYWLLDSVAILIPNVLKIDESNVLIIINDLLEKGIPFQVYDALAHYFNHKPVFEYLFSLYCELDKTPATAMKNKFTYFTNQLVQKEGVICKAGIKHLNKLNRLYQQILKAVQVDTIAEIHHKDIDMDITQPLYELEAVGFEMRPALIEMFHTLQDIDVKPIELEKYYTKKIDHIQEVQLLLTHLLNISRDDDQVGNKLINLIAFHWNKALDKTINEYQGTIKIELKFKEGIVENVLLNSSSLFIENIGGSTAGDVSIRALPDSLQPIPEPLFIGHINPGPGSEVQVPIGELLQNPAKLTGKFDIVLEISYKDAGKNPRQSRLQFQLNIMSSPKHLKRSKWLQYCEADPNLFNYPDYYPANYQLVSHNILKLIREEHGLLLLQGEKGVGRTSLLKYISLFLETDININNYYFSVGANIRGIRRKHSRFKTILHQILETVENAKVKEYNEADQYMEKIKEFFQRPNGVNLLFINNLEQLKPDSFVEFYPLLEVFSQDAVIVAAVDRQLIRLLRTLYKQENVLNISRIPDPDQENLFNIELGDDFRDVLPQNWRLLVGNHVYSTYLLARVLKSEPGKLNLDDCADSMWKYFEKEKSKGKTDYYQNVWNTLSLNEKLIVYICAREYTEVTIADLKPGLVVGSDPYLLKRKIPEYKILVKIKEQGEVVSSYYLKENQILDEPSIDYLQRARDRILFKDIKKGLFPIKIQNEETLLHKNRLSRRILANYLPEKGHLENKLKELCLLGVLREVKVGGEIYYCHNDYIFMIYLLRTFESYDSLVEKRDLVTGYTLKEIQYALNKFGKEDKSHFIKFMGLDELRVKLLEKLNNHWEQFKLDLSITQDFYDFLTQIFYLEIVKEHPNIQLFDHFCEGFFRFKIQVVSKFSHLILIIIPEEKADLTQLDIHLERILDYYKLFRGTELIFIITRFDMYKLHMDIDKYDINIVLLDENSLKQYIQAVKRELELLQQISHYLDLRILSPYRYTKGVSGDMFVGRKKELATIFNKPGTDFAIFGERKIGKTSLLKQIEYQCKERVKNAYIYPIFIDLFQVSTFYDFIEKLNNCLMYEGLLEQFSIKKIKNMRDFESLLVQFLNADKRTRLILLFDEIDDLYLNCFVECRNCSAKQLVTTENYERIKTDGFNCSFCDVLTVPRDLKPRSEIEAVHDIFASFRTISQTYQRCQFVFTGFKILYHLHRHHGSEFVNFTQPLDLGRLEYEDLKSLVVEPMKRLNIRFHFETKILEKLNDYSLKGIPWIIQFYCDRMIEKLADTPEPMVTQQLIDEIAAEVKSHIDQTLEYTITTSREQGLLKLILLYREKMGSQLGEEFRVDDLLELQKILEIGPDQLFKKAELEYYLDLFQRCFFLKRELKVKAGHNKPQQYFRLNLDPKIFESF